MIAASEEENGTIPVLEESGFTITSIQKYQVKIQGVEVYKKQGNGDWKKVTEQCTYEAYDDAHASSLALGKYEGKNENRHLVGGDRASFINEKFDQDYVNIEIKKIWKDPNWVKKTEHPELTFTIYRYEDNEAKKELVDTVKLSAAEVTLEINGSGNEKYAKYYDLKNYKPYTYVVEEQEKVENYKRIATGSSIEEKDGKLIFTFTNERVVEQEKIAITVNKNWNDPDWLENIPHKATFRLYRYTTDDKKQTEVGSITLEKETTSGAFKDLDKYYDVYNHKEYTYVVKEDTVPGYENTSVGVNEDRTEWTFTNEKIVADKVTLVVSKVSSKDEKKC